MIKRGDMGPGTRAVLNEADRLGIPTPQEERALVVRCEAGDRDAINELAIRHARMIVPLISKHTSVNTSADDAFQVGFMGLIRAAEKSSVEKWDKQFARMSDGWKKDAGPSPFCGYAINWARAKMGPEKFRFEVQVNRGWNCFTGKRSSNCGELQRRAKNCVSIDQAENFRSEKGRNVPEEHFSKGMLAIIDRALSGSDDRDMMVDDAGRIMEIAEQVCTRRELDVITRYYGVGQDGQMTLIELGNRWHLSREMIRLIKLSAIRKIRKELGHEVSVMS